MSEFLNGDILQPSLALDDRTVQFYNAPAIKYVFCDFLWERFINRNSEVQWGTLLADDVAELVHLEYLLGFQSALSDERYSFVKNGKRYYDKNFFNIPIPEVSNRLRNAGNTAWCPDYMKSIADGTAEDLDRFPKNELPL